MAEQEKATIYTGKVYNPEPTNSKDLQKIYLLSGKQKRMDKGRSKIKSIYNLW